MQTSNGVNEKELIKKLNNLKTIKPDDDWKKNYREILHSQISAGATANKSESNLRIIWQTIMPGKIFIDMSKSVWVTALISVLILVIGIGGVYAAKNSKPGDSLYIAKIISEKTQLVITFNEKDKVKLGLEFAANRAKEITQVLEEAKEPADKQGEKVKQLSQDFKKEIKQVKNRLTTIKAAENKNKENEENKEEPEVFGANLGKNNQRMEISEPVKPAATTTPDKALEEAEELFDQKNYNQSIDKLEEVNKVISQADKDGQVPSASSGRVKGESETATSTN
ncbi:MAG: hypothetical protein HYV53_01110 [Parcubacteria group bacterium]|nr:hypothetical protein [Parcubacteria group bacterium]